MQVGRDEIAERSPKAIKKGLQGTGVTGWRIRGAGGVFLHPISGREEHWKGQENSPD